MKYAIYRRLEGSDLWSEICRCENWMNTVAVIQALLGNHHGSRLYLRVDQTDMEKEYATRQAGGESLV